MVTYWLKQLIYESCQVQGSVSLNWKRLAQVSFLLFISTTILPLSLQLRHAYPGSCKIFVYGTQLYHNCHAFLFVHSQYGVKFYSLMFMGTFIVYYYLKTYPYANTMLTSLAYLSFLFYQIAHVLFKFSLKFEVALRNL